MKKLNIMKKILFTLAFLVSFGSFGQLDSKGNEYVLTQPTLEFENNSEMSKEDLMKELKCDTLLVAGRKYESTTTYGEIVVQKQDIIPKVISFDVSIGQEPEFSVKGNSIEDSPAAKNLLDKVKAGDYVVFSNILVTIGESPNTLKVWKPMVVIIK